MPEIAPQDVRHPVEVLDDDWPVEAKLLPDSFDLIWRRLDSVLDLNRVAGRNPVTALSSVDLPQPLGPISASRLPSGSAKLTSSSSTFLPSRTVRSSAISEAGPVST